MITCDNCNKDLCENIRIKDVEYKSSTFNERFFCSLECRNSYVNKGMVINMNILDKKDEIKQLKEIIEKQNKRIAELEEQLKVDSIDSSSDEEDPDMKRLKEKNEEFIKMLQKVYEKHKKLPEEQQFLRYGPINNCICGCFCDLKECVCPCICD